MEEVPLFARFPLEKTSHFHLWPCVWEGLFQTQRADVKSYSKFIKAFARLASSAQDPGGRRNPPAVSPPAAA